MNIIRGLVHGDWGHESTYVSRPDSNGYSAQRHVDRQCKDSDERNDRKEARKEAVGGFFNWLGR